MRIVFAGTPTLAAPVFEALVDSPHDVVLALTRQDAPTGRKRTVTESQVAQAAAARDIPIVKANRIDEATAEQVSAFRPDIGVVVAYGALLPPRLLEIPRHGWLNIHFSVLPRWRGAAPLQRALIAGDSDAGITLFKLDDGLDTGPVYAQQQFPIEPGVDAGQLLAELAQQSIPLLMDVLSTIQQGTAAPEAQQGEATHAPKLTREDAHLDFAEPAEFVLRRWAGVTPEPGAWAFLGERSLKLLSLAPITGAAEDPQLLPGELRLQQGHVLVGTGSHPLELRRVQPAGKQAMPASDWLRGVNTLERLR